MNAQIEGTDTVVSMDLTDWYWSRRVLWGEPYEPEVADALLRALPDARCFVDAGANIGVWTAFAATITGSDGSDPTLVALEPQSERLYFLESNVARRCAKALVLRRALWSQGGAKLILEVPKAGHAAATVMERTVEHALHREEVLTVTLDDLIEEFARTGRVVVKLDIEGAEVRVIDSVSAQAFERCTWIYEDHGSDPDARVTAALLARGATVLTFASTLGTWREVTTPEQVARLKVDATKGYNFIALRGSAKAFGVD